MKIEIKITNITQKGMTIEGDWFGAANNGSCENLVLEAIPFAVQESGLITDLDDLERLELFNENGGDTGGDATSGTFQGFVP